MSVILHLITDYAATSTLYGGAHVPHSSTTPATSSFATIVHRLYLNGTVTTGRPTTSEGNSTYCLISCHPVLDILQLIYTWLRSGHTIMAFLFLSPQWLQSAFKALYLSPNNYSRENG